MEEGWSEEYLEHIGHGIPKHSPEQLLTWLKRLGDPDLLFPQIHIAGTNGKGSTARCLASTLERAGLTCGLFTSPHLVTVRERFVIGKEMISPGEMDEACRLVREGVRPEGEVGKPSFFEFIFLLAMVHFARRGVDAAVIEVGVGGTRDATNVIRRKVLTVITPVGLDHTAYLGDTTEKIAAHKAGIIVRGVPVVSMQKDEVAARVIREEAGRRGAPLTEVDPGAVTELSYHEGMIDFSYTFRYDGFGRFSVPGNAPYQAENAACAAEGFMALMRQGLKEFAGLDGAALSGGLADAYWAGRMEEILPGVYVDGAHNEPGIRAFLDGVRCAAPRGRRVLLFSVKEIKDYRSMIRLLAGEMWDAVFVTGSGGLDAEGHTLAALFRLEGVERVQEASSVREGFEKALEAKRDGTLFICGSLYLAGEIRALAAGDAGQKDI